MRCRTGTLSRELAPGHPRNASFILWIPSRLGCRSDAAHTCCPTAPCYSHHCGAHYRATSQLPLANGKAHSNKNFILNEAIYAVLAAWLAIGGLLLDSSMSANLARVLSNVSFQNVISQVCHRKSSYARQCSFLMLEFVGEPPFSYSAGQGVLDMM